MHRSLPAPVAFLLAALTGLAWTAACSQAPVTAAEEDAHAGHNHGAAGMPAAGAETPPNLSWSPLDFVPLAHLAVQEDGRKKPLDTVARETMSKITGQALFSGNSNFKDPATGRAVDTMDLFLSIWLNARPWNETPLVLVGSMSFRQELGLNTDSDKKLFAMNTLMQEPCWTKLKDLYTAAQAKLMRKAPLSAFEKEAWDLGQRLNLVQEVQAGSLVNIVPHPSSDEGAWTPLGSTTYPQARMAPVQMAFTDMRAAYRARDNQKFTQASVGFVETLKALSPDVYPSMPTLEREVHYNHLHPFRYAWMLYLVAALVTLAVLKSKTKAAWGISLALFVSAFAIHAYGIYLRCMIAGRPPVTNMYESVVWVGAGCAFFGLCFELIHRPKYYMLAASIMAVLTLILADTVPVLSDAGKSIGPLVPVLRDNFWLTVHVLSITLGYAAFTLAWSLGHITLTKHLIQPKTTVEHKELHNFLYKVLMLGVLLLAAGTILGGVWANYSWGRFWGWDPKETWALIALLTYLVVLHGRYTGMWGFFGLSVGSVVCYLSVLMAWYGVNFVLGTGLHSYGFGASDGIPYVLGFVGVDSLFVTAVLIRRYKALGSLSAPKETPDSADGANGADAGPDGDHPWSKPASGPAGSEGPPASPAQGHGD